MLYLLDDGLSGSPFRVVVPSIGSIKLADVLAESFGTGVESGGLLIASSAPLTASSRTYNDAESGTFGQYVPVEAESAAIAGNDPVTLIQLTRNVDYRTNIGFANIGRSTLDVEIVPFLLVRLYFWVARGTPSTRTRFSRSPTSCTRWVATTSTTPTP